MNRTVERTLAILKIIANSEHGITLQEICQSNGHGKKQCFCNCPYPIGVELHQHG